MCYKYNDYHVSLVRTYMINASTDRKNNYEIVRKLVLYIIDNIRPGIIINDL